MLLSPIPNEVVIDDIVPHLRLSDYGTLLRLSKLWYGSANDILSRLENDDIGICKVISELDNKNDNRQLIEMLPKLKNLKCGLQIVDHTPLQKELMQLIPKPSRIWCAREYSDIPFTLTLKNKDKTTSYSCMDVADAEIYCIANNFINLDRLIIKTSWVGQFSINAIAQLSKLRYLEVSIRTSENEHFDFTVLTQLRALRFETIDQYNTGRYESHDCSIHTDICCTVAFPANLKKLELLSCTKQDIFDAVLAIKKLRELHIQFSKVGVSNYFFIKELEQRGINHQIIQY